MALVFRFNSAIYDQPYIIEAVHPINQILSLLLFAIGTTLVLSSFFRLGISGMNLVDITQKALCVILRFSI
jgi:hypothetical protein